MEFDTGKQFDTGEHPNRLLPCHAQATGNAAIRLVHGTAGDHRLIHAMLRFADQASSYEDFLTTLDEPTYEPTDRLLVKHEQQIIAHVQVLNRAAWFHGAKLPVGVIKGLATLPEHHQSGCERLLLSAAEQAMRDSQAVVALAHTGRPDVFLASGWSEIGCPRTSEASVHEILARVATPPTSEPLARREKPLRIRHWRQVELAALLEVYRQSAAATWGAIDRSEAYWRWLVGRHVHDNLIVAIDGHDNWDSLDAPSHIVGYAMTRGSQIVELATLSDFRRAAEPLLARACQDAIEGDQRTISLHIPATDSLHALLVAAGGRSLPTSRTGSGAHVAKLLAPARWIESIYEVLLERARAADLARPFALAFDTGQHRYRLELTRRSSHFIRDDQCVADVACTLETLGALFLGDLDIAAARDSGQLGCATLESAAQLAALFPRESFWQSPLDTLGI
jgi:ribosomal protein S18 acetylase RimI-like enzyme